MERERERYRWLSTCISLHFQRMEERETDGDGQKEEEEDRFLDRRFIRIFLDGNQRLARAAKGIWLDTDRKTNPKLIVNTFMVGAKCTLAFLGFTI